MFVPPVLLGSPRIHDDESLSSYLLRLSAAHFASPNTFCAMVFPKAEIWTRDIDRRCPDALLAAIAEKTGNTASRLKRATVSGLWGPLTPSDGAHEHSIWTLPVGMRSRTRLGYGNQYCADCLTEKPRFLRIQWRLAC